MLLDQINFLIDPNNITKYDQTTHELELSLLFWICAAGKSAKTVSQRLNNILKEHCFSESPFEIIKNIEDLPEVLRKYGIGCFNNKARTMISIVKSNLNLKTCSVEDLEKFKGIGPKTARCFLIHSKRNVKLAGLDTHILKYMRDLGYNVPRSTPSKNKYLEIENIFLGLVESSGMTVAEFDLKIWKEYSGKSR